MAVARCIRIPDRPAIGEVAIVVADVLQRQGVGTRLVGQLAELAVAQGITRFRAMMLSDNVPIQRLLFGLAAGPVDREYHGETTELELELPGAQRAGCLSSGPARAHRTSVWPWRRSQAERSR